MKEITIEKASHEIYSFIKNNYPWDYGSYEFFRWKHIHDPYCTRPDFYVMRDNGEILAVCVGRRYVYSFGGSQISTLSMMDFAAHKEHRQQGLITELSEHIKSGGDYDMSLGFSSPELYERVYHRFCCFQKYYTCQFSRENVQATGSEIVTDTDHICRRLSGNLNSLHLKKSPEYISYLKQAPRYAGLMAIEHDGLLMLINIEGNCAKLLDISEYTMESCMTAVRAMLGYADTVQADFPEETDAGGAVQKKVVCCISDTDIVHTLQKGEGHIWVPVTDRK